MVGELDLPSATHMALDEVLLDAVAAGRRPPLLRFWGWAQATLVLGSNQAVANELDLAAVERHGFTVVRRLSGGGTMLAEPGRTITWSLVTPATGRSTTSSRPMARSPEPPRRGAGGRSSTT